MNATPRLARGTAISTPDARVRLAHQTRRIGQVEVSVHAVGILPASGPRDSSPSRRALLPVLRNSRILCCPATACVRRAPWRLRASLALYCTVQTLCDPRETSTSRTRTSAAFVLVRRASGERACATDKKRDGGRLAVLGQDARDTRGSALSGHSRATARLGLLQNAWDRALGEEMDMQMWLLEFRTGLLSTS
jgi:hypothetical protein